MMYFYIYVLYRYAVLQYRKTLVSSAVVKRSGDVDCASVLWHEELQHSWQPIVNDSACSMTILGNSKFISIGFNDSLCSLEWTSIVLFFPYI